RGRGPGGRPPDRSLGWNPRGAGPGRTAGGGWAPPTPRHAQAYLTSVFFRNGGWPGGVACPPAVSVREECVGEGSTSSSRCPSVRTPGEITRAGRRIPRERNTRHVLTSF